MGLLPPVSISVTELEAAKEQYENDMPTPELLDMELVRWSQHSAGMEVGDGSITMVLDKCPPPYFLTSTSC